MTSSDDALEPRLIANIDGNRVEARLDAEPAVAGPVAEVAFVELCVAPTEPGTRYRIRVGSEPVDSAEGEGEGEGEIEDDRCVWPAATPFESARGRTLLRVESQSHDADWRPRGGLIAHVVPSKLGETRYAALFDELRTVSTALVYDISGKSARALNVPVLGAIEREWRHTERTLRRLAHDLRPVPVHAAARMGDDRRQRLALLHDPARRADVRALAGGLRSLTRSAEAIREAAADALDEIRRRRVDTDIHGPAGGDSLYDVREAPRVRRLEGVAASAGVIAAGIRSVRETEPFLRAKPLPTGSTALTRTGTRYAEAAAALRRTASAMRAVRSGSYRRPTSALYESWVYLRLVYAFNVLARSSTALDQLLHSLARRRFGAPIPSGTTTRFIVHDGRTLDLTFEPFVKPRRQALEEGDEFFREGDATLPLTPDVQIVLRGEHIERVAIVDAKYARSARPDLWRRLARYHGIRHTVTGRPTTPDVWLAAPIETRETAGFVPDGWRGGLLPLVPAATRPDPILRGHAPPIAFPDPDRPGSRGRHHAAERDGAILTAVAFARAFVTGG